MDNQILLPLVLFCGASLEREKKRERAALKQVKKTDAMSETKKCRDIYGPPGCYTPTLPTALVKL